jgi:cell division protein ZapA
VGEKRSVTVTIQGKRYRIRADGDVETVERAAELLDQTMARVRERSSTADSIDVAVLAALNLANRLTAERPSQPAVPGADERVLELIRLVEGAVHDREPAVS